MEKLIAALKTIPEYRMLLQSIQKGQSAAVTGIGQINRFQSLGWEDSLEEGMATHSSTLAWRIPWAEEPSRLQSMGWQRVGHD